MNPSKNKRGTGQPAFVVAPPFPIGVTAPGTFQVTEKNAYFLVKPFQYSEVMGLKVALVSPSPVTRLLWNW
ncbi:hypothetical protein GCM10008949_12590 [Deinococcus humi]|nr:hypothetical protein GCM10008949_12590 [Deinococcus humi]